MSKIKTLDCIRMKDKIQRMKMSQWRGLTGPELVERIKKDVNESKSPIAEWWRRLERPQSEKSRKTTAAR